MAANIYISDTSENGLVDSDDQSDKYDESLDDCNDLSISSGTADDCEYTPPKKMFLFDDDEKNYGTYLIRTICKELSVQNIDAEQFVS